ncbi:MAG: PD-(D/E)XK nuclease family protein [Endomicrobium sp.]|jgi:hypothetical protein|nr:PD-(D/E)XK nuclease family protein [Endomicrobium sp.]
MGKKINKKTSKKRDYGNDYISVTEVLGAVRKIGLEMWYKHHSAKECDELSEKAKEIGTQIHELIESYVKGEEGKVKTKYQEEVNNGVKSFLKFRKEHPEIKLEWAEQRITNDLLELNGTIDCIGKVIDLRVKDLKVKDLKVKDPNVDREPVIIDWKTGTCKGKDAPEIYTEYILQVGAYSHLYNTNASPRDLVRKAYIVVLAKDKEAYGLKEVDCEELWQGYVAFCSLLEYVKNRKELEKMLKKDLKEVKE